MGKDAGKKAHLDALTPDELAAKKSIIVEALCQSFDRKAAAEAAGLSMGQFRVLLARDEEFRTQVRSVRSGNDDEMADLARQTLWEILTDGDRRAQVTVALHLDKTRGGYGQAAAHQNRPEDSVHPVDTKQFIGDKPKKAKAAPTKSSGKPLPPEEDYPELPDLDLNFERPN